MTAEQIRATADIAIKGRWPDFTIILDMPIERSIARVNRAKDRIEQRSMEYHAMVRKNYLDQAKQMPDRYRVISGDRSPELVHGDVLAALGRK